jgi:hypothetical protein
MSDDLENSYIRPEPWMGRTQKLEDLEPLQLVALNAGGQP